MKTRPLQHESALPFKSVAAALLFSVILGPVGLLYASFWGGFIMIILAIVIISLKLLFVTLLLWLICCIWSVGAVESYNKKIIQTSLQA
jgi:hypothetical protein